MSLSDSWCSVGSPDGQPLAGFIRGWQAGLGRRCRTEPGGLCRAFWHRTMCSCYQGKYRCSLNIFLPIMLFNLLVCFSIYTVDKCKVPAHTRSPLLPLTEAHFCCAGLHHRAALLGGGRRRQNGVGCGCGSAVGEQEGSGDAESRGGLLDHLLEEGQWVPGVCKAGGAAASPPQATDCGCVLRLWRRNGVFLWCRESFPHVLLYKFSIHRSHVSVFQSWHHWKREQQVTARHPCSEQGQRLRWHHNITGHLGSFFQVCFQIAVMSEQSFNEKPNHILIQRDALPIRLILSLILHRIILKEIKKNV